mmetsp:Transcript_44067/g.47722  ORF Transcript_44067/g.47722 Transcript_44067/m.47722 type:complete len:179 (+) Transcript_44067:94-630(+)
MAVIRRSSVMVKKRSKIATKLLYFFFGVIVCLGLMILLTSDFCRMITVGASVMIWEVLPRHHLPTQSDPLIPSRSQTLSNFTLSERVTTLRPPILLAVLLAPVARRVVHHKQDAQLERGRTSTSKCALQAAGQSAAPSRWQRERERLSRIWEGLMSNTGTTQPIATFAWLVGGLGCLG